MLLMLALKSSVVLLGAFAAATALRRSSAAMRHLIWMCAFACLLVLPLLEWSAPKWRVTVPAQIVPEAAVTVDAQSVPVETAAPAPRRPSEPARRTFNYAAVWYAGAVLALLRLLVAIVQVRRITSGARPWLRERNGRTVLISNEIEIPITYGVFRPAIVFPSAAADWPAERFDLVLAHEMAHVERFDCLTQLMAEAVCALYWFHPLVWLAAAQFRKERERACDDAVLNQGTKSSDYAEHLLAVVRAAQIKGAPSPMAISIHSHDLRDRLKAVLKPHVNRRGATPKLAAAMALAALCIVVPIATMRAQAPAGTGSISGTVFDPSRAVVPRATVIATGLDTHNKEVTQCRNDGSYSFQSLPAGRYLIEVRAPGFKVFQQPQVIAEGANGAFNPNLEIGQVSETIEVVAPKPAVPGATTPRGIPQRIRVGGNVQAVKLVYRVPPMYPLHAKESGIQGTVVLQGIIAKDGTLLSLSVMSQSVDAELAQAARDAVSQWRYEPTLLNGQPVEVVTTITVNFHLE